ncbi:MAG: hypothetical protein WD872_02755 [Pirellulaceae bacterium]
MPQIDTQGDFGDPAPPVRASAVYRAAPAWLGSLALHFAVFTGLGIALRVVPEGVAVQPQREGGIVLVRRDEGKAEYFADADGQFGTGVADSAVPAETLARASLTGDEGPPAVAGPQLPTDSGPLVASQPAGSGVPSAGALSEAGGGKPGGPLGSGHDYDVQTQVFGVQGRGSRFVYVFDRSSSMSAYDGRPLAAAKRELLASLESLGSVHQFQIIFYNHEPQLMRAAPHGSQAMVFGNEEGKRRATAYVHGVRAAGGTKHLSALTMSLRMAPDVIFFLTDADQPQMPPGDIARIRKLNRGAAIHAIEFGIGPRKVKRNFLQQIAEENGGQYAYVDVTGLPGDK